MENTKEFEGRTLRPADSGVDHYRLTAESHAPYGSVNAAIVNAYLASGYGGDAAECEVEVGGKKYKVLRRSGVTAFYNEDGDTLFDVTNERLEREHQLMSAKISDAEEADAGKDLPGSPQPDTADGDGSILEPAGGQERPAGPVDDIKDLAIRKLEDELKNASDKPFAEAVIGHLIERCGEDRGLCEDVLQENKTWKKCSEYIYKQARGQAKENMAVVKDDTVYEWAEDYFHADDKAVKAEQKKEQVAGREKTNAGKKRQTAPAGAQKTHPAEPAKPAPEVDKKPADTEAKADNTKPQKASRSKKSGRDMDGQLDMFSMMGL